MRSIPILIATLLLGATLAFAEPQVRVLSSDGVARVELTGSYPQSYYTIFRSLATEGPWQPVGGIEVLCLGTCAADDVLARAGSTYWYRFEFVQPDGSFASFGPYEVTIPATLARAVGARVIPDPVRGPASIEVHLAGATPDPVPTEIRIFDLQGRQVRTVHDAPLARGLQRVAWDGMDDRGRRLGAGTYFVTVRTPLGVARSRFTRLP